MRGQKPGSHHRAKLQALMGHPRPTHPLPQSLYGPGEPPSHLPPEAADVWRETVARAPPGLLQPCDSLTLEALAVHVVLWRAACRMVAKRGVLQRDSDRRGGPERVAPWAKLAASEQRLVLDLSRALGLTPLSRSAVRVPPPQHTEPPSELEQILNEPAIDYSRPS